MKVLLKSDGKTVLFLSGSTTLNANDEMWQALDVEVETPLIDGKESLWVTFQHADENSFLTNEIMLEKRDDGHYRTLIPDGVIAVPGEWQFQLYQRTYDVVTETWACRIAADVCFFTVEDGLPISSGTKVNTETIGALYAAAKAAETNAQSYAESARQSASDAENYANEVQQVLEEAVLKETVGAANGVAPLNESGKVPSEYLPSYVDDVLEYDKRSDFPEPGESGKIYVDKSTNYTWRWSGTDYIQVGGKDVTEELTEIKTTLAEKADKTYFDDFNIENGSGENTLQQKYIIDGTDYSAKATGDNAIALGGKRYDKITDNNRTPTSAEGNQSFAAGGSSHAYGDWSVAIGKDSEAYQRSSFATGGGTRAGLTYDEWLVANKKADNDESLAEYKKDYSFAAAFGDSNKALGRGSFAAGTLNTAKGKNSFSAGGQDNKALGQGSHVEGLGNTAYGESSHAEGHATHAGGASSHSEGYETDAAGRYSHSEGQSTIAEGDRSHAEGNSTIARGESSHSEGKDTIASGKMSHAEGYTTEASGENSHSEGAYTTASGDQAHAEGETSTASGEVSHAEGRETIAEGRCSHAQGYKTHAKGDHSSAEGSNTIARGQSSHAEGDGSVANESNSHAEGKGTIASGSGAHAEGNGTTASNLGAHSQGSFTKAAGQNSFATGYHTIANGDAQSVFGLWNDNKENTLLEVGNGTSETDRKNAFEVLKDGRAKVQSAPIEDDDVVRKKELNTKIDKPELPTEESAVVMGSDGLVGTKKLSEFGGAKLYKHTITNASNNVLTFISTSDNPFIDAFNAMNNTVHVEFLNVSKTDTAFDFRVNGEIMLPFDWGQGIGTYYFYRIVFDWSSDPTLGVYGFATEIESTPDSPVHLDYTVTEL